MAYTSQYPAAYNDTLVKVTSKYPDSGDYEGYDACNPAKSLTGAWTNGWLSNTAPTNQRFHIDLGSAKIIRRIYYENGHNSGGGTDSGAKTFTFWGSNTGSAFADTTYGTDTNWTQLTISQSTFDQHVGSDAADPKYITVTNTVKYQYYAIKIADNYTGAYIAIRRVELQTEDGYGVSSFFAFL